jgi:tetratricopeptide (TPR) repeat protein
MWVLMLASLLAADAGQEVKLGVQAYREAQYAAAVSHFSTALRLDPGYLTARIYLGTAYQAQFVPGSDAPDNLRLADLALDEFRKVLDIDPENDDAISSIASLYYSRKQWADAREWYYKLTEVDPEGKESFYTLGVIAWSESSPECGRAAAGQTGPIPDTGVRGRLKARYADLLSEGIANLERALALDSEYEDAMTYMNLLLRERAALADSQAEHDRDIARGDGFVRQALEIKKRKAEHAPSLRP